jgi:beta-phosphoglucomutase-like phosphatase (HAD superfamily)
MQQPRDAALSGVRVLLCDADGTLFPSEEPAFDASVAVTNRFLDRIGSARRYEPGELRREAMGRNFRQIAQELAAAQGVAVPEKELDDWVAEELAAVTDHLGEVLRPDAAVREPLAELASALTVAVVSSSALGRLHVCLQRTGLADLVDPSHVLSAADSLPVPTSKPDPAVYHAALERLDVEPDEALAVEDAVAGVASAVGAGIRTVGILQFVLPEERAERASDLTAAGATRVVTSWSDLHHLLLPASAGRAS